MLVATRSDGSLVPSSFSFLPRFLDPGDVLVINTSGTLPAAFDAVADTVPLVVHLSTQLDRRRWVVEPRRVTRWGHRALGGSPAGPSVEPGRGRHAHPRPSLRWRPKTVGGHLPRAPTDAPLADRQRASHPLQLRRTGVAPRDLPERLRHRTRECGDAQCGPALHAGGHHPAGGQGGHRDADCPPHRGRLSRSRRAALSRNGGGAGIDSRVGQWRPPTPSTGGGRGHHRRAGARDVGWGGRPGSPVPRMDRPGGLARASRRWSPTGCSPDGTNRPRLIC